MAVTIEKTKEAWQCASAFSADKESVYTEHARAHGFDDWHDRDVLEYGCGGGSDAMSWMRRGNRVVYADVVPFNIKTATTRIQSAKLDQLAKPLLLPNSAPIPLPDASFDVISSHGVLHHIEDVALRDQVMSEFFRLARPGAALYVMLYTEQLREKLDTRVLQLMAWRGLSEDEAFCWLTDEPGCPYARAYTEEQGWEYIERAGFQRASAVLYNDQSFRTFKAVKP